MKKFLLLLTFTLSLSASMPYTLENLDDLRIYIINKSDFIDKAQEKALVESVSKKLIKAGFAMDTIDSPTFLLSIESTKVASTFIINTSIAVGEEVITKRKDAVETLAFTYHANDFMESKDPLVETIESVHFLLDNFLEAHLDDQE